MKNSKILFIIIIILALTTPYIFSKIVERTEISKKISFETVDGKWLTEADLLREVTPDPNQLWCSTVTTYKQLSNGLRQSKEYVKEGNFSGLWEKHNYFPSFFTEDIPRDWGIAKTLSFWVYSKTITKEIISLVVFSDNNTTPYKDFFYTDIKIDWTGWKEIKLTLSDFRQFGKPFGWGKIDRIGFYSKIFNRQPNPYTVLYFNALTLE
jgi:hypothetical protein